MAKIRDGSTYRPSMIKARQSKWAVARSRLLTFRELPGWGLYAIGVIELIWAWPWSREVGVVTIMLGLFDHGRGVWRAWGENDKYEWRVDP